MTLHDELLKQARYLATIDANRPKQVNLRRAISSAYYALFHLLIWEASSLYAANSILSARIGRKLGHAEMKRVSKFIRDGKLPESLCGKGASTSLPQELRDVAEVFVTLQEERHLADYELSTSYLRRDAIQLVDACEQAFKKWAAVRATDEARIYLGCFHLWDVWNKPRT